MSALPILLRRRPVWVSPVGMHSCNVAFREGLRLREVVHADRAGVWCAVNGHHEPDLERLLAPGDVVDEGMRPNDPETGLVVAKILTGILATTGLSILY